MTQEQHPITTPLELFKQWEDDILNERDNVDHVLDCAWRDGFRAGADQELEACCEWAAEQDRGFDDELRAARRPKPPSLKERALEALEHIVRYSSTDRGAETIRRALEQIPDQPASGGD